MNLSNYFCRSSLASSYCYFGGFSRCTAFVRDPYFYVSVGADRRLSNAKLEITGGNIESVEEVDEFDQTTENPNIAFFS